MGNKMDDTPKSRPSLWNLVSSILTNYTLNSLVKPIFLTCDLWLLFSWSLPCNYKYSSCILTPLDYGVSQLVELTTGINVGGSGGIHASIR